MSDLTVDPSRTDAVILVGGRGTRLRPLTVNTPKPMLPTAGYPFLQHLLARIKAAGITHVVLGTSYRAEVFEEYFGDGSDMGLEIEYVVEEEALGTGGGIRNVYDKLRNDTVMVFNGDVLGGTDLRAILTTHAEKEADVTMHLVRVPDPRAFGCVPTSEDGRVLEFLEKTEDPPTDQINAGCYVFRREIIEEIPTGRVVSVERLSEANCIDDRSNITSGLILYAPPGVNVRPQPTATTESGSVATGNYTAFDCGNPNATITDPRPGAILRGSFAVFGTATHPDFQFYRLQVSGGGTSDGDFVTLNVYNQPVSGGQLGAINTLAFTPGDYWIRLTVVDNTGNWLPQCTVRVRFAE